MKTNEKKQLLIIKVGTNVLADTGGTSEQLHVQIFTRIGDELRTLSDEGYGIILVSSGAITAGVLGEKQCRDAICDTDEEQRYAARGWDIVVQQWKSAIGQDRVSSTLLTKREVRSPRMRDKLLQVIGCCLRHDDVFVVNENDCLSDDEIKFGDNDTLAATLAIECQRSSLFASVSLVLLTNRHGLNRVAEDDTTIIRTVTDIDSVVSFAKTTENGHSRGGMITKVRAAKAATEVGIDTYIAHGRAQTTIHRALTRQHGTYFAASGCQ